MGLFFLTMSATDIYISSLPEMVEFFHTTPSMINLTMSAYMIGTAITVTFIGEISNKYGRRKIIIFGSTLFSSAALMIFLSHNLYLIILLRFVQAIGCAIIMVVPRLMLKDSMTSQEQIRANGILLMGLIISPAVAPILGTYIDQIFGWKYCFLFTAISGLALSYYAYKILPETNTTPLKKFDNPKSYIIIYWNIIKSPTFIAMTIIYCCGSGAFFAFMGIASYLYISDWGIAQEHYSILYVFAAFAYFLGNMIMQQLNKKNISPYLIIHKGVYSTAIGVLIIASSLLIPSITLKIYIVTIGMVFMRTANALISPPTQIMVMKLFDKHSAQALGMNLCCAFTMNSISTWVVTALPLSHYHSLIVVSGLLITTCFITYNVIIKKQIVIQ